VFGAEPTTGADDAGKQRVDRHVAPQAPSFPGPSFLAPAAARRHRQFGHEHIVVSSSGRSHSLGVLANEVLVTHGRSHTHTRVLTVLPGIIQYHCDESNGTQSRTVKFEWLLRVRGTLSDCGCTARRMTWSTTRYTDKANDYLQFGSIQGEAW